VKKKRVVGSSPKEKGEGKRGNKLSLPAGGRGGVSLLGKGKKRIILIRLGRKMKDSSMPGGKKIRFFYWGKGGKGEKKYRNPSLRSGGEKGREGKKRNINEHSEDLFDISEKGVET